MGRKFGSGIGEFLGETFLIESIAILVRLKKEKFVLRLSRDTL